MGKLKVKHRPERQKEHRYVFRGIRNVMGVAKMYSRELLSDLSKMDLQTHIGLRTHSESNLCQFAYDILDTFVARAQLNLAREVKQHICVRAQLLQFFLQPIEICVQILHAEQHAAVWTQTISTHCVLQRYQRRYINVARIWYVFVGRVKVDNGYRSIQCIEKLMFSVAIGGFP